MNAETHSQLANFIWSICNLHGAGYVFEELIRIGADQSNEKPASTSHRAK